MDHEPREGLQPTWPARAVAGGTPRGAWWRWLDASPVEAAGLAVLLVGAVAATAVLWWAGRPGVAAVPVLPTPAASSTLAPSPVPTSLTIHVVGEVVAPGVVALSPGARVADALAAAGGATRRADLSSVNLARPVVDGEQVLVPRAGAGLAVPAPTATTSGARRPDGRLDLNLATVAELEELPGVGPVLAGRIVAWRDANGGFADVGQLREVSGIGEATFAELEPLVVV